MRTCRKKGQEVAAQALVWVKQPEHPGESDFTTVGKNQSWGEAEAFVQEGANARLRYGSRKVLSTSQARSVPDNELSLKVPLTREGGRW